MELDVAGAASEVFKVEVVDEAAEIFGRDSESVELVMCDETSEV